MSIKQELIAKIQNKTLSMGVCGLGYVGLPLAVDKAKHGFKTIGFDVQKEKVDMEANVLDWEPATALFVPDADPLLFYRKIAELGLEMLVPGGSLYFEINRAYGAMMKSMLENMGYKHVELRKDMFGNDRMIKAIK